MFAIFVVTIQHFKMLVIMKLLFCHIIICYIYVDYFCQKMILFVEKWNLVSIMSRARVKSDEDLAVYGKVERYFGCDLNMGYEYVNEYMNMYIIISIFNIKGISLCLLTTYMI